MSVSLVKVRDHSYKFISAKPFAPNLGAEIYGVDLSKPISQEQFGDIFKAFLDHQVLFFKNQKEIPPDVHIAFGKRFGLIPELTQKNGTFVIDETNGVINFSSDLVGVIVMQAILPLILIQLLQPLSIHLHSRIYQLTLLRIFIITWIYQMPMAVKLRLMITYRDHQVLTDKQLLRLLSIDLLLRIFFLRTD